VNREWIEADGSTVLYQSKTQVKADRNDKDQTVQALQEETMKYIKQKHDE
jgi:hypothetical protein